MEFGSLLLIIEFLVFIVISAAAIIIVKRFSDETVVSDTIILVRDVKKAKGHGIGNFISKETGRNGRLHYTYLSRATKKPKVHTVISEPNKIITYPKGQWLPEKSIIEILPNTAQDYISTFLTEIEQKNADTHIHKALKEGMSRQSKHLEEIGEGEVSNVLIGSLRDYLVKILKSQSKGETKRPGTYATSVEEFKP